VLSFKSEKAHSHYGYYYNYTFLVSKEVTKNSECIQPDVYEWYVCQCKPPWQ